MLIVANGAFKCGSTWQFQILTHLVPDLAEVEERFRDARWRNPSIDHSQIASFLAQRRHHDQNFVVKDHIRDLELGLLLIQDPHVLVCNQTRDLRDVLVSAYHHDKRLGRVGDEDANEYYWDRGWKRVEAVLHHHRFWNVGHPGVFVGSYEGLHADFAAEAGSLAAFVGTEANGERIAEIKGLTSRESARASGPGTHFRKGIVGDWKQTLNDDVVVDIAARSSRTRGAAQARLQAAS